MTIITIATILWGTIWLAKSIRKMRSGDTSPVHLAISVMYLFMVAPLILDLVIGKPDLSRYPGLVLSQQSESTNYLYLLYVAIVFPIVAIVGGRRSAHVNVSRTRLVLGPLLQFGLLLALFLPAVLIVLAPNPSIYLNYAISQRSDFDGEVAEWHALVVFSGRIAQVAGAALLISAKRVSGGILLTILPVYSLVIWVHGKRSAVALTIALLLYVAWQRGALRGVRLVAAGVVAAMALGLFSVAYQQTIRAESDIASTYEGFRIDYGRDAQIQFSIYSHGEPGRQNILPDRVTTLPLYVFQFIPKSVWPDKPMPYAQYFTSAVFNSEPKEWGWGLTTNWFDEWLSNLGWSAFLVAPVVYGLLCRAANRLTGSLSRSIAIICLLLLLVQHVTAFFILIPVLAASIVYDRLSATRSSDSPIEASGAR